MAEIKSELPDNIVEIGIENVFAHNDDDGDDPFKSSDSDDNEDDPFNCRENDEEIVHKKKHFDLHKNVKISQRAGSVSQLNIGADKDNDTKMLKIKNNLQSKEVLLLNYGENDNSANKSKKETTTKRNKNIVENIDWSKAYQTFEETSVEEDMRKVIVTRVPFSYVAPSEYTIEAIDRNRCNHCQLVLSKNGLKNHIRLHHRDVTTMYHCPYCPYKQKSERTLKLHIISHHKSESEVAWFRCGECDFKTKLKYLLRKHILTHMQPEQIMDRMKKCDQCPKMFKPGSFLGTHIKYVHEKHKIQKLKCTECDYECFTPSQLNHHKKLRHSNIETLEILKCPNCPYETRLKNRLNVHVRQIHKEKIQCDKCAYTTDLMDKMRLHLMTHKKVIHEADMKYRCDKCPYKTYRHYSLTVHKLNHLKPEEIQYFFCYHCQFKAKRKDNLKTHILRHSKQNEFRFPCFICDFTAKKKDMLIRHIDKHSKEGENQQSKSVVSKKKPTKRKNPKTKVASPAKQLKGKEKIGK